MNMQHLIKINTRIAVIEAPTHNGYLCRSAVPEEIPFRLLIGKGKKGRMVYRERGTGRMLSIPVKLN